MKSVLVAVAFTIALLPGLLHAESKGGVEEAKKGIEEGNAKLVAALAKGDAAAMASLYTSDAIVLPPDQPIVKGSKEVLDMWKGSIEQGAKSATLKSENVEREGDLAVETGVFTFTIAPKDKPEVVAKGKYVVVWKHQKDGSWKLHRDIWNATPDPKK